jgi:hypothetical protein
MAHFLTSKAAIRKSRLYEGWGRTFPVLLGFVVALLSLALSGSATASQSRIHVSPAISQTSIGGLRLGLAGNAYRSSLAEQGFATRYANGTFRLYFDSAEISVMMSAENRGIAISTSAPRYSLGLGISPCGLASRLQARHPKVVSIPGAIGPGGRVYRLGRLWITLRDTTHIGRITLAVKRPALSSLVGATQCGAGEVEGH